MLFTIVTVLVLAATVLGLAFHRFWTTREEARSSLIYVEIAKRFFAWLALRAIQITRRASPKAWWTDLKRSRSKPDRGFAAIRCKVINQKGEPVIEYGYRYMIACRT